MPSTKGGQGGVVERLYREVRACMSTFKGVGRVLPDVILVALDRLDSWWERRGMPISQACISCTDERFTDYAWYINLLVDPLQNEN